MNVKEPACAWGCSVLRIFKNDKEQLTLLLPILQVPVGRETLGRIMNVIGEPVDECGPISGCLCCDTDV